MCKFFSFISRGDGKFLYATADMRKDKLLYSPDSHTSLATHFFGKPDSDDSCNKYEYDFFTKVFTIDQINTKDDSDAARAFATSLNIKDIIPSLIKAEIEHPFKKKQVKRITKKHKLLLKRCAIVRDSVWDSVWSSVWSSVGDSVRSSVWSSVGDSVRSSVWDSVRSSVWDSVWSSVRDSVGSSVYAQMGSMFDLKKAKYPFQVHVDLWDAGIVPTFDGTIWRLHSGEKADIVFSITEEELLKIK
jgi:hypothetical protein